MDGSKKPCRPDLVLCSAAVLADLKCVEVRVSECGVVWMGMHAAV